MVIRKPELLLQAIMSLDNSEKSDIAFGLAKVLSNLHEVDDAETSKKLDELKKDCYKGLSLDECLEIYNMYRNINPFVDIYVDGPNIRMRLIDLKGAFRDLYYKILDYVLNLDFQSDYAIGKNNDEIIDRLRGKAAEKKGILL